MADSTDGERGWEEAELGAVEAMEAWLGLRGRGSAPPASVGGAAASARVMCVCCMADDRASTAGMLADIEALSD